MDDSLARVTISEAPLKESEAPNGFAESTSEIRSMGSAVSKSSSKSSKSWTQASAGISEETWQVITLKPRIDAFNHADLVSEIHEALAEGSKKIALDLTQNRFFSLNAIQFCMSVARDLYSDGGSLALIGCMERTKRHFDIYGSLKQIRIVRSVDELVTDASVGAVNVRHASY